jgi:hypothetical protein
VRQRPPGVSDEVVDGAAKASEAREYLIRARGHLYSFHQLMGRVDFLLGDVVEILDAAGHSDVAGRLRTEAVGRNVLDGRWTFQIVEEFDSLYCRPVEDAIQQVEDQLMDGQPHVYESELKERRRTTGFPAHERRPPLSHDPRIETDLS